MEFPLEFKYCPLCTCMDTVAQLACADEPSIPKGTFVSLEKIVTPIQQPTSMLSTLVRAIVCHYDVCAECGHRYCTKAEKTNVPVQFQQAPSNPVRFDPKSHKRL